jgi:hypothetical protein
LGFGVYRLKVTLKQKEDAARTWLRQELLVVTTQLVSLLESSNLSEDEKRQRALVHHIIVRDSEDVGLFHNIHSRTLSSYLGNSYSEVLNWLLQHDCLDINHIYSSDIDAGFSKSYRIPGISEDNREASLTALTFNHERIQRFSDDSNPTDAVSKFVLCNLNQLTVRKSLIHIDNIERRALGLEYCKWVYHKRFNVRYGDTSKRLFHTVIRMVKEARGNLMLETTQEPILYFDITACYPNLLPYWATDVDEKTRLVEVLQNDFYAVLASHSKSNHSRDELKRIVSRFLCHPDHPSNNVMGQWMEQNCPILFDSICAKKSMALELQNLEAGIFVERLGNLALLQLKWFVPMHDGFLCRVHDGAMIKHQAETIFEKVVGHKPLLKQSILGL